MISRFKYWKLPYVASLFFFVFQCTIGHAASLDNLARAEYNSKFLYLVNQYKGQDFFSIATNSKKSSKADISYIKRYANKLKTVYLPDFVVDDKEQITFEFQGAKHSFLLGEINKDSLLFIIDGKEFTFNPNLGLEGNVQNLKEILGNKASPKTVSSVLSKLFPVCPRLDDVRHAQSDKGFGAKCRLFLQIPHKKDCRDFFAEILQAACPGYVAPLKSRRNIITYA